MTITTLGLCTAFADYVAFMAVREFAKDGDSKWWQRAVVAAFTVIFIFGEVCFLSWLIGHFPK
jgi:hypothetical protein